MTTFLFTSAPLFSHLDWGGYLKTAQALIRRGHSVVWAMEEGRVAHRIRQAGVEVEVVEAVGFDWNLPPEPHDYDPESWAVYRLQRNFDTWLSKEKVAVGTQALIDLTQQHNAQVIVSDPFLASPALAAEVLDLPYAVVGMPAISPVEKVWLPAEGEAFKVWLARLDELCTQFKVKGRHFVQLNAGLWPHSPDLHLSFFAEDWYDWRGDVILPQNQFVGGAKTAPRAPLPPWFDELPSDLPLVFITLGSTFNYEPEFFATAIKAIFSMGAFAVVATYDAELTTALSENIPPETALIRDTLEVDHLFPRLRGLIQHGGPGTTHAAILHALPQIVVAPGPGQGTQAHLVSRAGLSQFLPLEEVTLENLRTLIASVMTDSQIKVNAERWQAKLAALPGIAGAADGLEGLVDG
jgi:hypothetical protein